METINFTNANDLIAGDLKNAIVPAGYVRITLSTQGKISNAPASCFARAMTAAEVLSLSLYIRDELQGPLIGILDSVIYKTEDIKISSVAEWTPEEVIEFTIKYYSNFFGSNMTEIDYIPTKEELEWLKENKKEAELDSLTKGLWKPTIELDFSKLDFHKLPDGITNTLSVSSTKKDFSVGFRFPWYGDILLMKEAMDQFEGRENQMDKSVLITLLSNAVLIKKVQGTAIPTLSAKEKLDLVMNDPKFSMALFDRINEEFEKIKFGVVEEITVISPITKKSISRRFQFRSMDVLSTLTLSKDDGYAFRFE